MDNVLVTMKNAWYNPSGIYSESEFSKEILEKCRNNIRKTIKANKKDKIVFTSSGCESNSLALDYMNYSIIYDPTSHASVLEKCKFINDNIKNSKTYPLTVNNRGIIDMGSLYTLIMQLANNDTKIMISVCLGNNETGTIQNIKDIINTINRCKNILEDYMNKDNLTIVLHVDATQYIADQKTDVVSMGIDLMTFSGHKLGCPSGIGCLYIRNGVELSPIIFGKQEYGLRGGTENLPYIVAMSETLVNYNYDKVANVKKVRDYLIQSLNKSIYVEGYLIGDYKERLSNHVLYNFIDTDAMALAYYLDVNDIKCSTGSACNTLKRNPSAVLKELGFSNEETYQVLRFTINEDTTLQDVDILVKTIDNFYKTKDREFKLDKIGGEIVSET